MTTFATIGRPVTRQEGPDKVSGTFLYSADVNLPGMLWGKVLRSPYPHARIVSIDISAAEAMPGVRAIITGEDTAGMRVGRMVRDVPLLAEDIVRFVGEKVAAVAADDPDTAEEALLLIDVEYEPLPAVFDPVEAMDPSSQLVHEGNPVFETSSGPVQLDGKHREPLRLVRRRHRAGIQGLGTYLRACFHHHLGPSGVHGALRLRGGH